MARLGVLKPLRGTEASLANVVLDEGEIAFSYPTTGPGTGLGGIKMGDGVKTFANLDWYVYGGDSPTPPDPWEYDEGVDEAALINNIQHCEYEVIGKIYYIQSYCNNGSGGTPYIDDTMPYMVIGINHDDTTNTMDLMAKCAVYYNIWNANINNYTYGQYNASNCLFYNWIHNTCKGGYSDKLQQYMQIMQERYGFASGNQTRSLTTVGTYVKLLNPREAFGNSVQNLQAEGFPKPTDIDVRYGTLYEAFTNSTGNDTARIGYVDKALTNANVQFLNTYFGIYSGAINCNVYGITNNGGYTLSHPALARLLCPVIRLSYQ